MTHPPEDTDPFVRLRALLERMVAELRTFDDGGDNAVWAAAQGTADDVEMTLDEIDDHINLH